MVSVMAASLNRCQTENLGKQWNLLSLDFYSFSLSLLVAEIPLWRGLDLVLTENH